MHSSVVDSSMAKMHAFGWKCAYITARETAGRQNQPMPPSSKSAWLKAFESEDDDDDLNSAWADKLNLGERKPVRGARIGRPPPHPSTVATAFEVGWVKHPKWLVVQCTQAPPGPPLVHREDKDGPHGCRVIPEFFQPLVNLPIRRLKEDESSHLGATFASKAKRVVKTANFKRPPLYPSKTSTAGIPALVGAMDTDQP
jgi:hypothetical protein